MKKSELRQIIKEEYSIFLKNELNELKIEDPKLQEQIKKFANLSNEIDKLSNNLKQLNKEYKSIEDVIRPILEELDETKDRALEVENILVTIKKKGFDRTSVAYKEAFVYLYERVNPAMKKIADEALKVTEKTSRVASTIAVQKNESVSSIIKKLLSSIKSFIKNSFNKIKGLNDNLKEYNKNIKKYI